ncbi:MAG: type II secretion system F family protein [Candidatus Freyarchaeota archaeon]|nr:type II secretion system F family protein [Candidatus Jordarchaeia archaeon]
MLKERIQELKAVATLLSGICSGLKSGLSPESSLERAINTNYNSPLKPTLSEIRNRLIINALTPAEALKQLSENIRSPRLRATLQILSSTIKKNASKTGEILEEILSELMEDLKTMEEHERQIKAQEIKLKIIIFTTSCAQGALSSLIPQLKLILTPLLGTITDQNWITLIILAASTTLTTYIITRATSLNRTTTPLALTLFLISFYTTSLLTKALSTQSLLNIINLLSQL